MTCPHPKTRLLQVLPSETNDSERISYRECVQCSHKFYTAEVLVPDGMTPTVFVNRVAHLFDEPGDFAIKQELIMEIDWKKVENYLEECEKVYTEIGSTGTFALQAVINPCRDRFNAGERSQALADEIMEISL